MNPDAEDDVARAVRGDHEALVSLLTRNGPLVRRRLAGCIPMQWQSVLSEDDVMQETYASAYTHIAEFGSDNEKAFLGWLETIARRNLLDAIRALEAEKRGGHRRRVEPGAWGESYVALMDKLRAPGPTASRVMAAEEAQQLLERALAQLPEPCARVVRMYDLEGRTVGEVAQALGRSPGAVFMIRARALVRLHGFMGPTSAFYLSRQ